MKQTILPLYICWYVLFWTLFNGFFLMFFPYHVFILSCIFLHLDT
jgi:hypothetical protein